MARRNPFSSDGSFSVANMLAAVDAELRRVGPLYDAWVRNGRMGEQRRDERIGTWEALRERLADQMQDCLPPELQGTAAVIVHFESEGARAAFRAEQVPGCVASRSI